MGEDGVSINTMSRLPRSFYERNPVIVAKDMLGQMLVRKLGSKTLAGRIVEAEAYGGLDDPGSHAHVGRTKRNQAMFGEAGRAYVYFTYGNHFCLNAVAHKSGEVGAVLIRALEPVAGIDLMRQNRPVGEITLLTSGPGRLTRALRIEGELNGADLVDGNELFICPDQATTRLRIRRSSRIGLSRGSEKEWRFLVDDNPFVSTVAKRRAP